MILYFHLTYSTLQMILYFHLTYSSLQRILQFHLNIPYTFNDSTILLNIQYTSNDVALLTGNTQHINIGLSYTIYSTHRYRKERADWQHDKKRVFNIYQTLYITTHKQVEVINVQ